MNYIIDTHSKTPVYIQLYNQIKNDIVMGAYPYHSKLPSKRTISSDLGISVVTVQHAYELLCDEGYVEARERSGFFIIFRRIDGFITTEKYSEVLHHQHHREDRFAFPFSVLAKTMRKVISDQGSDILAKTPHAGLPEFREIIKQYLARNRDIYVDIEQIIIGSGAEYLYSLIVTLLGKERKFAIEWPSYEKIEGVYKNAGIQYETLPLVSDGIDSTALAQTKATVLHVSPFRSFPSGVMASASKKYEYIRWGQTPHRIIIEDDFESEFTILSKPEETLFTLTKKDNVIYLNTFSKTVSPSLRTGYMVLPKSLIKPFYEKLSFISCPVPTFQQLLLAQLISNGDFEKHINRIRRIKRKTTV